MQVIQTLSSAEADLAEFLSLARGGSIGLGAVSKCADVGHPTLTQAIALVAKQGEHWRDHCGQSIWIGESGRHWC
eukprot:3200778-Amphidinium_carterae.3